VNTSAAAKLHKISHVTMWHNVKIQTRKAAGSVHKSWEGRWL